MTGALFLLGPDEWDDGFEAQAPAWLVNEIHDLGHGYQPKHLRVYLNRILQQRYGIPCIVMDPADQTEDETDDELFHRLETENQVKRYIVIVPPNTKILGTVFEGGMLVRDFHYGRDPVILCFFHATFAQANLHERVTFTAKGKRTRYLESLAAKAHHVDFWDEPEDLVDRVIAWATLA